MTVYVLVQDWSPQGQSFHSVHASLSSAQDAACRDAAEKDGAAIEWFQNVPLVVGSVSYDRWTAHAEFCSYWVLAAIVEGT